MRVSRLAAIIFIALVVGIVVSLLYIWDDLNTPEPNPRSDAIVSIPLGWTPDQIVGELKRMGIIHHVTFLRLYMKIDRGKLLKAGDYAFGSPISDLEILQKLESGEQGANKITIVEGWTRWDIANAMAANPTFKLHSKNDVLKLINNTRSIKDLDPTATSLEGYIYPETYFALANSRAEDIINEAVDQFKTVWRDNLAALARMEGKSVHEVVTVASIIETEAKLKEERAIIASVIYNRLKKHMPLGMDSTVVYASKLAGKWRGDGKVYQSDVDRDSPYNTRKYAGLPIGPVGCPGLSSLQAALQPADTTYIYYVRDPARNDGAHKFFSDEGKFQLAVQALRNWEKQRDLIDRFMPKLQPRQSESSTR